MKSFKSTTLAAVVPCLVLLTASHIHAQKPASNAGSTSTANGASSTNGVNGARGTLNNNSNTPANNNGSVFDQQRPVFLMGNVLLDDGNPPNSDIRIERVCNGSSHLEAHTDSKGRFSFQVGGQAATSISDADASSDSFGSMRNGNSGFGQSSGLANNGRNSSSSLMGCELRASYPGYVSEIVDLSMRHSMDDAKVGTILLHRLVNVKGTTISVTSSLAPKSAQKSYEKGMQLAQKGKFEEAEAKLTSATDDYPKYALAYFDLGRIQQRLNKLDDAQKSYLAAAAADSHYVSPYDQLALLAAQQSKWDDTAKYSKQATDLNPIEFPSSFWYNALANYNLKNNAEAEKSARALAKLDSRHRYPQVETMLAEFAANRGELDDAAAHLRTYLTLVPNAQGIDAVKHELATIEQAKNPQAKAAAPAEVAH